MGSDKSKYSELTADKAKMFHDINSALNVCAGFQSELRLALESLSAELSDPSVESTANAVQQLIKEDIEPCTEFMQVTFDRLQEQLEIFSNACRIAK